MSRRPIVLCALLTAASLAANAHAVPLWSWESGTQEGWGYLNDIDTGWGAAQPAWTDKVRGPIGVTDGNVSYQFKTPATTGFGFDEATLLQASNITGIDPTQAFRWDSFRDNNLMFVDMTVVGERTAPLDPNASHYVAFWPAFNGPDQAGHFIGSYDNPIDLDTGATSQYQLVYSTEYYTGARTRTFTWDYLNAGYNFSALAPTDTSQNYTFLVWSTNSNTTGLQAAMDNLRVYRARATDPTWNGVASGTWTAGGSWANGSPNAVGAIAVLKYSAGLPAVTISLDTSKTVGSLVINSAARSSLGTPLGNASAAPFPTPTVYTINAVGGASLTLDNGATGEASIVATSAGNTINAPVNFNSDGVIDLTADVRTGNQDGVPGLTGASLAINGNVSIAAGKTLRTTSVGALALGGNVIGGAGSALHIGGGTTKLTGTTPKIAVGDLGVATSAQLDLGTGSATVDYTGASPLANLLGAIKNGYDTGLQDGKGIVTSAAGKQVGIVEASSVTLAGNLFLGTPVDGTTVLIRVTFAGDFDVNGIVDFNDLVSLAQNYNGTSTTWRQGDANYDGKVDFNDLVSLAQNYNKALSVEEANALGANFAADFALAQTLVPEPTTLACIGGVSAMALRRRRDR